MQERVGRLQSPHARTGRRFVLRQTVGEDESGSLRMSTVVYDAHARSDAHAGLFCRRRLSRLLAMELGSRCDLRADGLMAASAMPSSSPVNIRAAIQPTTY
jgi:hypothetical protein